MSTDLTGRVLLNQFRVERFVAAGGMATVYRVYDVKRSVSLAMKVLHEDLNEDPAMYKRFQREADALMKLAHPNIVPFYGLYHDGFDFILQRFIDGATLKDMLKEQRNQPLPINDVLVIMKAICAALGYSHANGLVHCDIKPGNVMVDQGGIIYLADFGIARYASQTTTTIGSSGTPGYMAPEQILSEPVSPSTDLYSLGVMLYEMLTGRRPFMGSEPELEEYGPTTELRVFYAHLNLTPISPLRHNPKLPAELSPVVLKALEKNPAARYQSAQEMYEALCSALNVRPEQVGERLRVFNGDQPGPASLSAAVPQQGPVVVPTMIGAQPPAVPQNAAAGPAQASLSAPVVAASPGKSRLGCIVGTVGLVGGLLVIGIVLVVAFVLGGKFLTGTKVASTTAGITQVVEASTAVPAAPSETISPTLETTGQTSETVPTLTSAPVSTPSLTPTACTGAKPSKLATGMKARVCTKKENVILRLDANIKAEEVKRIPPGTLLTILDGPKCSDNSTWWRVRTDKGERGWAREGSDAQDPYFICPVKQP